jgi:hypothetical protein
MPRKLLKEFIPGLGRDFQSQDVATREQDPGGNLVIVRRPNDAIDSINPDATGYFRPLKQVEHWHAPIEC